jgi:hypothetical protein
VPLIRWGATTSSDKLRQCARCTACGHKGATIQHPRWGGADVGFLPFPVLTPPKPLNRLSCRILNDTIPQLRLRARSRVSRLLGGNEGWGAGLPIALQQGSEPFGL